MSVLGIEDLIFVDHETDRKNREALAAKGIGVKSLEQIKAAEEAIRLHKQFLSERPDIQ